MENRNQNSIIDINFRLNPAKWALSQPLCSPLLIVMSIPLIFFGAIGFWVLGIGLSVLVLLLVLGFGLEVDSKGITYFSLVFAWIKFHFSKKAYFKKEIYQVLERYKKDCIITKNYIYNQAYIATNESIDQQSKDNQDFAFNKLIKSSKQGYFNYVLETKLEDMTHQDTDSFLSSMREGINLQKKSLFSLLSDDLYSLAQEKEFKLIKSKFSISTPTNRKEPVKLKIKTLNNEMSQLSSMVNGFDLNFHKITHQDTK